MLVVFYPQEEDSTMIGMNTSQTSLLTMYLKDRKMKRMVMSPKSDGVLYPMDQIPADKMRLPTFSGSITFVHRIKMTYLNGGAKKPVKHYVNLPENH